MNGIQVDHTDLYPLSMVQKIKIIVYPWYTN